MPEDVAMLGIERDRCDREVVLVDAQRQVRGGAEAVNAYLGVRLPPAFVSLEAAAYRFVARHRVVISRLLGTAKHALVDPPVDLRA